MTEQKTERETKEYLEEIQKTVQRSKELLEVAKGKIEETRKKCEELGIDPECLKNVDVGGIQGLPEDLKKVLMDDQVNWEQGLKELMGETHEDPNAVRQNRLEKLGALKHPYRL